MYLNDGVYPKKEAVAGLTLTWDVFKLYLIKEDMIMGLLININMRCI